MQVTKNTSKIIKHALKHMVGLLNKGKVYNGTVELLDATLVLDPKYPQISYGSIRPFPKKYHKAETDWYNSADLCIKGHPGIENNKTWSSIATEDGMVNSNYGYLVHTDRGLKKSQFNYAVDNLVPVNGNSGRQSIIYYTGPDMQEKHNDGIHAKRDWTCTSLTQHFIRDNKLYYQVKQRSCDLIYGLTFDFAWHCEVYNRLLVALKTKGYSVGIGTISMNFGSLHVYERHFDLIQKIVKAYDASKKGEYL